MELASAPTATSAAGATIDELALMFPSLDPDLVRCLAADAPTPGHAMETLLALVAASSEPFVPSLPPKDLPLGDINAFPSLTDGDGWEVVTQTALDRDPDEELGSVWRDRAKAVAAKPAPTPASTTAAPTAKRRAAREKAEGDPEDALLPETDYEMRQRRGQTRAKNRAQFGRGGGKGAGRGKGSGYEESKLDESDGEEQEDEGEAQT